MINVLLSITFEDLFNSFFGAILGGIFTVTAAALVLNAQLKANDKNEIKKYKPYLFATTMPKKVEKEYNSRNVYFESPNITYVKALERIVLRGNIFNSSESSAIIKSLIVNDNIYNAQANQFIDKSMLIIMNIELDRNLFSKNEYYEKSFLIVSDLFGNEYKYKLVIDSSRNVIEEVLEE